MILYRPIGKKEYARKIAEEWNTKQARKTQNGFIVLCYLFSFSLCSQYTGIKIYGANEKLNKRKI
jgi:hypothetical protein